MEAALERYVDSYHNHVREAIEKYFHVTDEINFPERFDCSYKEFAEQIVQFSLDINSKANELLADGSLNESINPSELQKKLFEIGKEYIKMFTYRHRQKSSDKKRLQDH